MTHVIKRASILFALVAMLFCLAPAAHAGQTRIPSRVKKAAKGDWVLVKFEDRMMLETVTDTEEVEDDYMVHYTMQNISLDGKAEEPQKVVRLLSDETAEHEELLGTSGAKVDRKRAKIDGKNVAVITVLAPEEDATIEHWFSDDVGIDGKVAMIVKIPEMDAYKAMEVIGFGDAKSPFNLRKYVK